MVKLHNASNKPWESPMTRACNTQLEHYLTDLNMPAWKLMDHYQRIVYQMLCWQNIPYGLLALQ